MKNVLKGTTAVCNLYNETVRLKIIKNQRPTRQHRFRVVCHSSVWTLRSLLYRSRPKSQGQTPTTPRHTPTTTVAVPNKTYRSSVSRIIPQRSPTIKYSSDAQLFKPPRNDNHICSPPQQLGRGANPKTPPDQSRSTNKFNTRSSPNPPNALKAEPCRNELQPSVASETTGRVESQVKTDDPLRSR